MAVTLAQGPGNAIRRPCNDISSETLFHVPGLPLVHKFKGSFAVLDLAEETFPYSTGVVFKALL